MKRQTNGRKIAGWVAVGLSTLVTCIWAFWGIVENFHEGWYAESLLANLGMMLVQYLSPMLMFMAATLVAIYWPRVGGGFHALIALLAIVFFKAFSNAATFLIILPLLGLGALYWFGRPHPRKTAALIATGFPLLTLVISGISPVLRVAQRFDDGNYEARFVQGNGVELLWAPEGPGWPLEGGNWHGAQDACQHLSEDGLQLQIQTANIWRLPTVEEAVRSMGRHGINSEGIWDAENAAATYRTTPDKESPLWNVHSQVIYWWTATGVDADRAYIIVYDGVVWSRSKDFGPAYLGFRCVK